MKKVLENKILNIKDTTLFDNKFLFDYLEIDFQKSEVEVFFMSELLKKRENTSLLNNLGNKYAMYSNVYSEKDEFEIFKELFDYAINNNKKIHIIGITLKEELEILEKYYENLGFLREDINCFKVDFSIPLVTVSVNIENFIWRGSDYKKYGKSIFFIPPIREAGLTKAVFKGINRGVIASIYFGEIKKNHIDFLQNSIIEEHIFPINLAKILYFNMKNIGFIGEKKEIIIDYSNNYNIVKNIED